MEKSGKRFELPAPKLADGGENFVAQAQLRVVGIAFDENFPRERLSFGEQISAAVADTHGQHVPAAAHVDRAVHFQRALNEAAERRIVGLDLDRADALPDVDLDAAADDDVVRLSEDGNGGEQRGGEDGGEREARGFQETFHRARAFSLGFIRLC